MLIKIAFQCNALKPMHPHKTRTQDFHSPFHYKQKWNIPNKANIFERGTKFDFSIHSFRPTSIQKCCIKPILITNLPHLRAIATNNFSQCLTTQALRIVQAHISSALLWMYVGERDNVYLFICSFRFNKFHYYFNYIILKVVMELYIYRL